MSNLLTSSAVCFGKVPSRGDFIKGAGQHQLVSLLDRWVSQAMELLSEDARWKAAYDAAHAVDFVFVGARSRLSVVGHLRPSADSSGRRFPFLTAAAIERDDGLMFRCAPAGLDVSFTALSSLAEAGTGGRDIAALLVDLEGVNCARDFDISVKSDPLGNFVRRNTVMSLAVMLGGSPATVRRMVLAIGFLLRPVLGQTVVHIEKDILLPLPGDARSRNLVAGLWLYLVSAFLRKTTVELGVAIERQQGPARLVLGFNGSSPATLVAAIAPEMAADRYISLVDPEWIEDQQAVKTDYGLAKLSSYLAQPDTSLEQVVNTFREVFLGE